MAASFPSTLVLGGARSGKSRLAETMARETGLARVYIATAQALDEDMAERIARHRADRGAGWTTVEVPLDLAAAVSTHAASGRILLIDCLTLWLSNIMLAERDIDRETAVLIEALRALGAPAIVVSNEVGLGIVPDNALARRFRDVQGRLNQAVAAALPRVIFIAAGLPLALKGALPSADGR
ncbi:MAG: bifunctional adenosylcobinamide kinase/adenosylcobinamide-phosphate guanylyltransferase [Rhizobiales bacterium 65-9]|nr:bifunctional adenosylcobinamide kinase/adenosylcobinamide-phosphate guanylyltransferase [Hyphomicrobiales bacterium]OJY37928.1 MAG: bifunctional adenosylcobinamide kinase/adenosylcobinamide-phosphate guanylyltransferase [Rhizobiales bacterium 65-9]